MKTKLHIILDRMIEDSEDIIDYIKPVNSSSDLSNDRMRKKALSQSILNLGENTKLLEKEIDLKSSTIDWRGLKGMREIAAHRYHSLDNEIIYDVAKTMCRQFYLTYVNARKIWKKTLIFKEQTCYPKPCTYLT